MELDGAESKAVAFLVVAFLVVIPEGNLLFVRTLAVLCGGREGRGMVRVLPRQISVLC
jgi:hypothetical protein